MTGYGPERIGLVRSTGPIMHGDGRRQYATVARLKCDLSPTGLMHIDAKTMLKELKRQARKIHLKAVSCVHDSETPEVV